MIPFPGEQDGQPGIDVDLLLMKRSRELGGATNHRGCVLSIGNFDGVHLGHQTILARLAERARSAGVPAAVLTFEPHPLQLLNPGAAPPRLTTADQKAALLAEAGVDLLIEYPTDWALLKLTPDEFFERIVIEQFAARGLVEGSNFFFGRGRSGNVESLTAFCRLSGMSLDVITPAAVGDVVVSSSLIRAALTAGEVTRAREMLGRAYAVRGLVREGAGRGRTIGFPTANLHGIETLIPADGVYAGRFRTDQGTWPAAVHVGPNPTFAEGERKVEAHLLDFSDDLYGQSAELELFARLREVRQFTDSTALCAQLNEDIAAVRKVLVREAGG